MDHFVKASLVVSSALFCGAPWAATLPEAVEQAIMRNPEVMARYHTLRAAENEQDAARGNWFPRLDVEAFAGRERQDYPARDSGWYTHPGASATLRQTIFDGYATWNNVTRVGWTKLARYYDLLATSDDIALETARAYTDVLRYRRLGELARDNWATHREVFAQIEDRVKAGVGRRVDLEQAAGRLALAQSNWLTENTNLHDVSQRYRRIVGQPPAESMPAAPDLQARLPQDRAALPAVVAGNPQFLAAVANLRAARAETDLRRANNLPTLELRVGQNFDRNLDGVKGDYNATQAQVVLNYNLFRGGTDQARIREAGELYYAAVDIRDKTCRDVAQTAAIAMNDVAALREQIQYLQQHALSTEKARDAYRQQFDIGQRTLLDLLDTENELFEARRALERANFDLKLAQYRVLAASHALLPALNLAPLTKQAPDEARKDAPADDAAATCAMDVMLPPPLDTAAALAGRPPRRADAPAPQAAEPAASAVAAVEADVRSWVKAWESKNVKAYMAFYADSFKPEYERSAAHWRAFREKYVRKPGTISIDVEQLAVRMVDADTAEAKFLQKYRSDDYTDDVRKTLVFKREAGKWRIVREYADPPTRY